MADDFPPFDSNSGVARNASNQFEYLLRISKSETRWNFNKLLTQQFNDVFRVLDSIANKGLYMDDYAMSFADAVLETYEYNYENEEDILGILKVHLRVCASFFQLIGLFADPMVTSALKEMVFKHANKSFETKGDVNNVLLNLKDRATRYFKIVPQNLAEVFKRAHEAGFVEENLGEVIDFYVRWQGPLWTTSMWKLCLGEEEELLVYSVLAPKVCNHHEVCNKQIPSRILKKFKFGGEYFRNRCQPTIADKKTLMNVFASELHIWQTLDPQPTNMEYTRKEMFSREEIISIVKNEEWEVITGAVQSLMQRMLDVESRFEEAEEYKIKIEKVEKSQQAILKALMHVDKRSEQNKLGIAENKEGVKALNKIAMELSRENLELKKDNLNLRDATKELTQNQKILYQNQVQTHAENKEMKKEQKEMKNNQKKMEEIIIGMKRKKNSGLCSIFGFKKKKIEK